MSPAEFASVRRSVDRGLQKSQESAAAAEYVRNNIADIVGQLRHAPHVTVQVGGSEYRIDREQLKSALR